MKSEEDEEFYRKEYQNLGEIDSIIEKRNKNFRKYYELISNRPDLFYVPENYPGISSFSLPFICKSEEIYEFFFVSKFGVMHLNISEDTLCTASSIDPSDYDKSVFNTDYTETLVLNTLTFFVCDNS